MKKILWVLLLFVSAQAIGQTIVTDTTTFKPAVFSGGRLYKLSYWPTPLVASGTYTPTRTAVLNLTDNGGYVVCTYMRIGAIVMVSGVASVTPTATGLAKLSISLPIASALTVDSQVSGNATTNGLGNESGSILGDATNDRAVLTFTAATTTARSYEFQFTYQVL